MAEEKRFCPNCGSTWVEPDTSNRAEVYFSGGNPNKWQCNDCGYTGLMPQNSQSENSCSEQDFNPESESKDDIEFEPEEEYPREDIDFGIGYLKYLIYILLPALLIYIIYLIFLQ